ncbi:MAG: hypothetical protein IPK87_10210 [Planctomycetes bacterium]|nr:hypothetical protein [Planctomycetota bacterium]
MSNPTGCLAPLALACALLNGCVTHVEHAEIIFLGETPNTRVESRADLHVYVVGPDGLYRERYGNGLEYLNFYDGDTVEFSVWGRPGLRTALEAFSGVPVSGLHINFVVNADDLRLVEALPDLEVLWVGGIGMKPKPEEATLLNELLARPSQNWKGLGGSNALELFPALADVPALMMDASQALKQAELLGTLGGVESLWLTNLRNENLAVLDELKRMPALKHLRLQGGEYELELTQGALDAIAACPRLEETAFIGGYGTSERLCFRLPKLVHLDLGGRLYHQSPIQGEVGHAPNLRYLRLGRPAEKDSDAELGKEIAALSGLRRLEITVRHSEMLKPLFEHKGLEALTIRGELLPGQAARFKHLKFLNVERTPVREEQLLEKDFPKTCRVRCIRPNRQAHLEGLFGG